MHSTWVLDFNFKHLAEIMPIAETQDFNEKVEEDFLFFLEHYKEAFDGLKSESDKEICKVIKA